MACIKWLTSFGLSLLCAPHKHVLVTHNTVCVLVCCSGPGWPALDTLWGKLFLVWTPESFLDYLNLYPNLENALCFVSSVDGNSGDDGGTTATDPAGVFIQTYDGLSWSSPVTADEISSFDARVRFSVQLPAEPFFNHQVCCLQQQLSCRFESIIFAHQRYLCYLYQD